MTAARKPIICLDFDGVVHSYTSGWKGAAVIPDQPVPGALEFVVTALDHAQVAIFSSRSHQWGGKRAMKRWLRAHLLAISGEFSAPQWWLDRIYRTAFAEPWEAECEHAADLVVREISWPWFKPPALVSLDDRAIQFSGEWPRVADLLEFKPWNKR